MDSLNSLRRRKVNSSNSKVNIETKKEKNKVKVGFKVLPTFGGFVIPFLGLVALQIIILINKRLPQEVLVSDEQTNAKRFVGQQAELYLAGLIGNGTPRVTGSYENEVVTINFLRDTVTQIINDKNPVHKIEYDVQEPIGGYYLAFKPYGVQNNYDQIKNFVVRLSSDQDSGHSVLVNCHFDTVPESPGASDDGIGCAIMLEILRKLSQRDRPLKHNVIFLFNGAEENPLQASHGFIAHHKWAGECRVFLNLEGAGAGGRELLFQTSSNYPWLAELYSRVAPFPSGNVLVEEVFQKGDIPSDTDFRVFRDFGSLPGFDFAYYDYPYIYHTRLDQQYFISGGVYQHTGDNILELVKALSESDQIANLNGTNAEPGEPYKLVYYDFFGLFMVVYSEWYASLYHGVVIILSLVSTYRAFQHFPSCSLTPFTSLTIYCLVQITNWLATTVVLFGLAFFLDFTHATMGWHHHLWLVIPLYGTPLLFCGIILPYLVLFYYQSETPRNEKVAIYMTSVQFIFTVLLSLVTLLKVRSGYFFFLFVLFPSTFNFILQRINRFTVNTALISFIVSLIIPTMYSLYILVKAVLFFAPVSARSGVFVNPEITLVTWTAVFGILAASYLTPLFLLFKSPQKIGAVLLTISAISAILIISSHSCFPYSGDRNSPALQRFYVLHSERQFYDEKSNLRRNETGYWVIPMDRNDIQYIKQVIPELNETTAVVEDCESELYCGLPVFLPRMARDAPYSNWIPGPSPNVPNPTTISAVEQHYIDNNTRRIKFNATGADHITVLVSPVKNVQLINWSFDNSTPPTGMPWGDRSTYMLYYSTGRDVGLFQFHIDLKVPSNIYTGHIVDIAVIGSYMHHSNIWTSDYIEFMSKFPDWTNVYRWVSTYKSFQF